MLLVASLGLVACDVNTLVGGRSAKPTVTIQSPATGSVFREGEEITVQSTSKDQAGIMRVELAVDGAAVRSDSPPVAQPQPSFTLVQKWKAVAGSHTLSVRAFNAAGAASDPAMVAVTITAASAASTPGATSQASNLGSEPTATATPLGGLGTVVPSVVSPVEATSVPTRRPPTRAPTPTTLAAPPGVYALSIRLDPPNTKRGASPTFLVTFLNTTGKPQAYRWFIKVYEPDKPNSKGETSKVANDIPPGTSELASATDWAIRGPGPCEPFIARVFWYDRDSNQTSEFSKPDASGGPAAGFQVCP
jgi:hypothetical protein